VAAVVLVVAAACSSGGNDVDRAGPCAIQPGTVCRNEKLQGVSMVAANLRGADFSGADLSRADLRNADLRNAKFVNAQLGGADFSGANLTSADLTGARLYYTNFTGANMTRTVKTGTFSCNVIQPDGGLAAGVCPSGSGSVITTPPAPKGPPSIQYFRATPPARCLNDASGAGIEVEWSTRNVTGLVFSVDGIRIPGGATKPTASQRLPFLCDGKPHTVTMQAFGAGTQNTTASFTVSLGNTAPLAPPGA
jgi:Pentapeptide repeats (8 copies)